MKSFLGKGADAMIALEKTEQKYDPVKHRERLDTIIERWGRICDIIREEIPPKKEIERLLDLIDAPKLPSEIGLGDDLKTVFFATKDIRDKYVLSRLLWDLGLLDDLASGIDFTKNL